MGLPQVPLLSSAVLLSPPLRTLQPAGAAEPWRAGVYMGPSTPDPREATGEPR